MTGQDKPPSIASLRDWSVGVTKEGLNEVRFILADKDEARAWAVWLTSRWLDAEAKSP